MDFNTEAGIFLAYALGILAVYFFGRMLLIPLQKLLKLLACSLLGGIALVLMNAIGSGIGIMVPVNLLTAAIAGVLGLPGVVCMIVYFSGVF